MRWHCVKVHCSDIPSQQRGFFLFAGQGKGYIHRNRELLRGIFESARDVLAEVYLDDADSGN
jgi:hypothetical protein